MDGASAGGPQVHTHPETHEAPEYYFKYIKLILSDEIRMPSEQKMAPTTAGQCALRKGLPRGRPLGSSWHACVFENLGDRGSLHAR